MVRYNPPDKKLARQIQKRDGVKYVTALKQAREILDKLDELREQEENDAEQA